MILCFVLSMPNVGSWDGKWTGEGTLYARVENFGRGKKAEEKATELIQKGRYHYNFGDGWSACVSVKEVDSKTAASIRRKSKGFCGYDWMIRSIKMRGEISIE